MSEEINVKHSFLRPSRKKESTIRNISGTRSEKTRRKSPKPKIKNDEIDSTPRFKKKNKVKTDVTNLFNQDSDFKPNSD